eukprot:2225670-Pyramimonas_sp.AAC.1
MQKSARVHHVADVTLTSLTDIGGDIREEGARGGEVPGLQHRANRCRGGAGIADAIFSCNIVIFRLLETSIQIRAQ